MSDFGVPAFYLIACNEFKRVVGHPLVIVLTIILIMIAVLNGIGATGLSGFEKMMNGDVFIKVGLSQTFWHTSIYCTMAAMFVGLVSVAGDRTTGSLNVLISKPLYKRDVIAGKFLGVAVFILLLLTMTFTVSSLLLMLFFRAPLSFEEFSIRLITLILLLFLECCLAAGIAMLFGILFKNLLDAAILTVSFLYLEWYTPIQDYLGSFYIVSPSSLYVKIFSATPDPHFTGLIDTSLAFTTWANVAAPYIVLMVLYLIAVLLINSFIFSRSEKY
jgi:ABC-2 type transport system permease protein